MSQGSIKNRIQQNNGELEDVIDIVEDLPDYVDTSDANATENDIVEGKSAYVNGVKITGIGQFVNNQDKTITENGTYTADSGYTGLGEVTVNVTDSEYTTNLALSQQILGPVPYIPLEYIESNGTEYIDTNYSPKTNTDFEILTELIEDNGTDKVVFGSRIDNQRFWLDFDGSGSISKFIILGYGDYTKPALYEVGKKYNIKFNSTTKKMTVNNNSYDINTTFNATNSLPIYIFRANYTSAFYGKFKLYELKFYESGNLVHYYIPVKRKSDNEICMYDKVTNQFFTNQGTGSFIAGPEI